MNKGGLITLSSKSRNQQRVRLILDKGSIKENYKKEKSSKGVNIKNGPHFPTVYGSNGNDGVTVSGLEWTDTRSFFYQSIFALALVPALIPNTSNCVRLRWNKRDDEQRLVTMLIPR